ncbi:MAG: SGNH/GDSL hydrolase family protein [Pirellulales bacterium]|nr:SGNH/GDSL hydrolase family protein [Pirellulales bacterium]
MTDPSRTTTGAPPQMTRPAPHAWWRRACQKLLLMGASCLVAVLLAEIMLRLVGYSSPVFLQPHEIYGTSLRPNLQGWFRLEGKAWNEFNSQGYHDVERIREKPPGTIRIAVLGDSYTAAQQVTRDKSFVSLLEKHLNAAGALAGKKVEVLNFGCNGYGTAQELLVFRHEARHYSPDYVILAFLTGNDISDNSRALYDIPRPFFILNPDQSLRLDNSFLQSADYQARTSVKGRWKYWLIDHSRLAQLLNTFRLVYEAAQQATALSATNGQAGEIAPGMLDDVYLDTPPNDTWRNAWDVTAALIRQLHQEVREANAQLLVVSLSNPIQVSPELTKDPHELSRSELIAKLGVADLFAPDRKLQQICQQDQIPCLLLAPSLWEIAKAEKTPLHGFAPRLDNGHWNERGHSAAADLIAKWLVELPTDADQGASPPATP